MHLSRRVAACLAVVLSVFPGCRNRDESPPAPRPGPSASVAPVASTPAAPPAAPKLTDLARALRELSEPTEYFFSDNLISNETSYLDPAPELAARPPGGVYLGVGPEQNFSYIARTRPELAVIVDIRRDNALLHLLYRALFERAQSRAHFLGLLFGRGPRGQENPAPDATLEDILKNIARLPADRALFGREHEEIVRGLRERDELALSAEDFRSLRRMHEAFFQQGAGIRFELHEKSGRNYPTLGALLALRSPRGDFGSFLGSEEDFRFVRELERRERVWFVVGDFGKPAALRRIAEELKRQKLVLRTFYVSNVEQYLFGSDAWRHWLENLDAFPKDAESALLRAYLDQGQRHPKQRPGQRTASYLVPLVPWLACERERPSKSYLQAVTRDACDPR